MKRKKILFSFILLTAMVAVGVLLPTRNSLRDSPGLWSSGVPDELALAPAWASSPPGSIALLSITESENGAGLAARPLDPATLADLTAYAPLNFGHHYTYALSPNRKTLALITWPSGSSNTGGALHLVDLDAWTDTLTDLDIGDYVGDLTFSADGKTLYWTLPTAREPTHGMPYGYQLHRYDLESHQASTLVQFPETFMPWGPQIIQFSPGKLALFGVPTDANNLAEDAPRVFIVDLAKNRITAEVRLDGVKAGQFFEPGRGEACSGQGGQYVMYRPGRTWDLEDKRLYLVHAQDAQVTSVDLIQGTVSHHTGLQPPASIWARLFEGFVLVVHAKGGLETEARAVLNGQGDRLYTLRQETECGELKGANLQVTATGDMRAISHLNALITDFALTPDNQTLLVTRGETVNPYSFEMMVTRDLYVLEAETLAVRAQVRVDQADQLWLAGFSPDGRYAYVTGSSAQWVEESGWRDWRTTWYVWDLNTNHLTLAREGGGGYAVLLPLFP